MAVIRVFHSCLLIELGPIRNSMKPYCNLRVVRTTAYLKAIMEVSQGGYSDMLIPWGSYNILNATTSLMIASMVLEQREAARPRF